MHWLTDPLGYGFFVRALIAGTVIGALCGAVSVFVVLRRMSYIGHGLAHSVLGGVAVALAIDVDMYLGAVAATLVSVLLIQRVSSRRGLHADAAIGIVTTALFALGIVVVSTTRSGRVNTEALLFGNILGIARADLILVVAAAAIIAVLLFAFVKPLLLVTFDRRVAGAHGIPVVATEVLSMLLVAGVVVVSVRVLGVLLVSAAVVIPAATARLACSSLGQIFAFAIVLGAGSADVGLYTSYHLSAPSGATIVLTAAAFFIATSTILGTLDRRYTKRMRRAWEKSIPLPVLRSQRRL